jgi:membrane-associated phospholipid phosphatase
VPDPNADDARCLPGDTGTAPQAATPAGVRGFRLGQTGLLLLLCLTGLVLAFAFDTPITEWVQRIAPPGTWFQRLLRLCVWPFRWGSYVVLAAALALHVSRRRLLLGYCTVLVVCFGLLYALKYTVGRARPDQDVGPLSLEPLQGQDSFPSGHATQAVLLATLLGLYFPRSRWFFIPVAVCVCASRLALERHFASDVVAGSVLAVLVVHLCVRLLGRADYPRLKLSDWRLAHRADS